MITDNSISVILRNIAPNSKVLELGCAHGRMTRYMKEQLSCSVDIVEIDEEAGQVAARWANKSFGGDLEDSNIWNELNDFECNNYDAIIFADVLEHLRWPEKALSGCKQLLKPNGSIWVSIPNIAHNSVIIDLMRNKFEYRDIGLLDNTHLRFFTFDSFAKMVEACGLTLVTRLDLINTVEFTEFNNSYKDVPEDVANFLKIRELGEVYQFVLEIKL